MKWITDWAEISDTKKYLVCAINSRCAEEERWLSHPQILSGWQVKRLIAKCYAALPMPAFDVKDMP